METNLRNIRRERGWSQGEAAAVAGIPVRRYRSYEYGDTTMPFDAAVALADAFDVSLDHLAGRVWPAGSSEAVSVTPPEAALVADFRRMDDGDRDGFLTMARALAFAGDAKKRGPVAADRMAGRVLT